MNTIQVTRVPVTLVLAGSSYPVRLLNYRELAEMSAWLDAHVASPLDNAIRAVERARAAGMPLDPRQEEALLDRASEKMLSWPPRPGTDDWFSAIDSTPEGMIEMVRIILSKTVPGFDGRKAAELFDAMTGRELLSLVLMAVRGERPKDAGVVPDPDPDPDPGPEPPPAQPVPGMQPVPPMAIPEAAWGPWRE